MTTIVSAAVLDDRTGKVYEGRRHFDPIMGAAIDEDLDNSQSCSQKMCGDEMKRFYEIQSTIGSYIQLINIIGDNVFYIIPDTEHSDYITIIIRVEHVVDLHHLLIRLYGGAYVFSGYEEADALWHWDGLLPSNPIHFGEFIRGMMTCKKS